MPAVPEVSILIRQNYPLNRQLDPSAGELVLRKIENMGVQVLTQCEPVGIVTKKGVDGSDVFTGFKLRQDEVVESDMTIFAIGIKPRDDLARASGIRCAKRGGVDVGDDLMTSEQDIYAIGECASWRGNVSSASKINESHAVISSSGIQTYGLIAPGVEMADILSFNLTQTAGHAARKMNNPDLSTKLKLMGVDVASFGDFFADERMIREAEAAEASKPPSPPDGVAITTDKPSRRRRSGPRDTKNDPIRCLTYHDPFSATYKKYIFRNDGKNLFLVGGIMVGDTGAFTKMVSIVKKKKPLTQQPSEFIIGARKEGEDDGADLDDDVQICSCHVSHQTCLAEDGPLTFV